MDLKNLVIGLKRTDGPVSCVRRFENYKITFVIRELMLHITKVQHIIPRPNHKSRVSRRMKLLFKGCRPLYKDFYISEQNAATQTEQPVRANRSTSCDPKLQIQMVCAKEQTTGSHVRRQGSQTEKPERADRSTSCDPELKIEMVCAEQQTLERHESKQSSQTDNPMETRSTQSERSTLSKPSQTEEVVSANEYSQTVFQLNSNQTQTEFESEQRVHIERETVVFLLNEIGEIVMQHGHLLNNNATLLAQISDVAVLRQMLSRHEMAQ